MFLFSSEKDKTKFTSHLSFDGRGYVREGGTTEGGGEGRQKCEGTRTEKGGQCPRRRDRNESHVVFRVGG